MLGLTLACKAVTNVCFDTDASPNAWWYEKVGDGGGSTQYPSNKAQPCHLGNQPLFLED